MTDTQEWIDASRAHADQATNHVASIAAGVERWTMKVPPADADTDIMLIGLLDGTLPQALNALQAVHDLHQPVKFFGYSATWLRCTQGCPTWPCPTVQAIQTELERKKTQA